MSTEGLGVHWEATLTAVSTHNIDHIIPLVIDVRRVSGRVNCPRGRPRRLVADKC